MTCRELIQSNDLLSITETERSSFLKIALYFWQNISQLRRSYLHVVVGTWCDGVMPGVGRSGVLYSPAMVTMPGAAAGEGRGRADRLG